MPPTQLLQLCPHCHAEQPIYLLPQVRLVKCQACGGRLF